MVKILHAADFHLGSARTHLDRRSESGKSELLNTFLRMVDFCKEQCVDFALLAGDLFDTPFPASNIVSEVIFALKKCPSTTFIISPGNHDFACPGSVYCETEFPPNVLIFNSFLEYFDFPEKNLRIFGAAFTDRFERLPLLSGSTDVMADMINICVLHGQLASEGSDNNYNPITPDTIRSCNFDYLALGHVHKRSEIRKLGNTSFAYCGCPDGRGFDEEGSCGVYVGVIDKGVCELEYVEFSSRLYLTSSIDITNCQSSVEIANLILEKVRENYPETYGEHLYRINLSGTTDLSFSPNLRQIEKLLSHELLYTKISNHTTTSLSRIEELSQESSLRGVFVKKLLDMEKNNPSHDPRIYRLAMELGLGAFESEVTLGDN